MDITIKPARLKGTVQAIPSKSQAHRLLICAAFADRETTLYCPETNRDIEATVSCLRSSGAQITRDPQGYTVRPVTSVPRQAGLHCGESGSTLRFMLPIVGALGVDAIFHPEGRLPERPLSPLWEEMIRMGCQLSRPTEKTIRCTGKLVPGNYFIDGSVSSQFITGLLLALSLIKGKSTLTVTGKIESKPYIQMTGDALKLFGADSQLLGECTLKTPGTILVEGDWSNAAFFLGAESIGNPVTITGLNMDSSQGDRRSLALFHQLRQGHQTIDAADIPDLVPILSVAASAHYGATFLNIGRLRIKESDRVDSVCCMLQALGGQAIADESTLTVFPAALSGGTVNCCNDHRIAMSAAIAATLCSAPVTLIGAECVSKSYPSFWQEYQHLGGQYEQHIR